MNRDAVVFQSAPTLHVTWVDDCMASVEKWAESNGAEYRCVGDDEFLGSAPHWVRGKCEEWINPLTNLARLLVARHLLSDYALAIWVDADVLIWAPECFGLPAGGDATFSSERWMERWPDGSLRFRDNVSNYICSFARGGRFLDRHITDVLEAIRTSPAQAKIGVGGTTLLTRGYARDEFDLIQDVANFSPVLTEALIHGARSDIAAFEAGLPIRLVAANLCLSHVTRPFQGKDPRPESIPALMAALLELRRPLWPSELLP